MHRSARTAAIAMVFSMVWTAFAHAQGPRIAQVKNVAGKVTIVRDHANLPAKAGDFLYEKDVIETGDDGAVGVTFTDNTTASIPATFTARC
jgi:hypothetical protein